MSELDDLKQAWADLDRRVQRLDLSARGVARDPLRALRRGQTLQIVFGTLLALWAGSYWTAQREPMRLVCGLALHAYGVLIVALSITTLVKSRRVRMSDPLVETQARILALASWRLRGEALVLAIAGCFSWIPALVIAFAAIGVELPPSFGLSLLASGLVALALVLVCVALVRRGSTSKLGVLLRNSAIGSSIAHAQARLDVVRADLSPA